MTGIKRLALAAAILGSMTLAAFTAQAADEGGYIGITGGRSDWDLKKSDFDGLTTAAFGTVRGSSKLNKSPTFWSFVWGYRLTPYAALEASYISLGTAKYHAGGDIGPTATPTSVTNDIEMSAKGPALSALGIWPITKSLDVYGRVGVLFTDAKFTIKFAGAGSTLSQGEFTANSRDMFYGVGVAYHHGVNWTFRFDYQRFQNVGDDFETGEANVNAITLGVMFNN